METVKIPDRRTTPKPASKQSVRETSRLPANLHPALGVTELLEQIFVSLQYSDMLLGARSTCKFWRDCIERSNTLKKNCLRIPDFQTEEDERLYYADSPEIGRHHDSETGFRLTRLIQKGQWKATDIDAWMGTRTKSALDAFFNNTNESSISFLKARKALNEVEDSECDPSVYFSIVDDRHIHIHKTCRDIIACITPFGLASFRSNIKHNSPFDIQRKLLAHLKHYLGRNTKAPWANHQLTRPAITKLYLFQDYLPIPAAWLPGRAIENEKGITVGQLLSVFVDLIKTNIQAYTLRDWMKAYRIYFETSYMMIDGLLLGPEVSIRKNVATYKAKVFSQSDELQTLVRTIF
ncbi:hypothetical protein PMIN04_010352 [Paraphaeosphaeria minitans]